MFKTTCLLLILTTVSSFAKTVKSTHENIIPSSIDQKITLVDKNEAGVSHKKVSFIVTDHGMSTDVSPRYSIYLGYASLSEMGNIFVDFKISDKVLAFKSATRQAAGIYKIKFNTLSADDYGLIEVTQTIDATKIFSDELKARKACGGDFCDQDLKTSVEITEIIKKL